MKRLVGEQWELRVSWSSLIRSAFRDGLEGPQEDLAGGLADIHLYSCMYVSLHLYLEKLMGCS